jgi:hypothetical protein
MQYRLVNREGGSGGTYWLHLKGLTVEADCKIQDIEAARLSETSANNYQSARHNIPEDLFLLQRPCESLKSLTDLNKLDGAQVTWR